MKTIESVETMENHLAEWQPVLNVIGGNKIWRIGKPLRKHEPLDAGNVEYAGTTFSKFEFARTHAMRCNEDQQKEA